MAALNSISLTASYRMTASGLWVQLKFERKRAAYALIALENLRFGKINTLLLQDSNTKMTAKLQKSGKQYPLSLMMTSLLLTENHIECVLSLLLDAINGTALVGQHYDFTFPGLDLCIMLAE